MTPRESQAMRELMARLRLAQERIRELEVEIVDARRERDNSKRQRVEMSARHARAWANWRIERARLRRSGGAKVCVWCGARSRGLACAAHSDLLGPAETLEELLRVNSPSVHGDNVG